MQTAMVFGRILHPKQLRGYFAKIMQKKILLSCYHNFSASEGFLHFYILCSYKKTVRKRF